jgi:Dullard-like phosphatase family protein
MDETLVHSKLELRCPEGNTVRINDPRQAEDRSQSLEEPNVPHDFEFAIPLSPAASNGELIVRVHKRPGLDAFLEEASSFCNLAVFTAGTEDYGRTLLDLLDPCGRMSLRLFRDSCSMIDGLFLKDLSKVKGELSRVVLIDNSPVSMLLQPDNSILVSSFYTDREDNALYKLLPILRELHHMDDVRPYLVKEFALRAALEHSGYDLTEVSNKHEILTRQLEAPNAKYPQLLAEVPGVRG